MVFGRGTSRSEDDRKHGGVSRRVFLALGAASVGGLLLTGRQALAAEADAYVSAFKVRSQTDGVGPFDADDEPGNDSSATNFIVRSFDSVNYLLEYTTELSDKTKPVEGATRLIATFTLPMDPSKARFDAQTLNWAQEATTTYWYEDGTSSTTWDKSKTVTKQVYHAVRLLEGKGADDRVPGAGQLSVGIKVYAAVQGEKVLPTFELVVDGDGRVKSCQPQAVTVSSYPRFNIDTKQGWEASRNVRYANWETGSLGLSDDTGTLDVGRAYGDSVGLALRNTTSARGLKGLELPTGDITFDIVLKATLDGADVTLDDTWGVMLWDYFENVSTSRGHLNRSMSFEAATTMPNWGAAHPSNKYGTNGYIRTGCYNGGTVSAVQDDAEPNVWHVTLHGYQFDLDDFKFPEAQYASEARVASYGANIGYFHTSTFMPFARFPRKVDATYNYRISLTATNLHAVGMSGTVVTTEEVTSDNVLANAVTLYAPGSWTKYVQFNNNLYWSSGAAWAAIGGTTVVRHQASYSGAYPILDLDQLCKIDSSVFDITSVTCSSIANASKQGTTTVWYAAKPDGSGWASDLEMDDARVEQLIFYRTLDELKAAGKVCVGILRELRDGELHAVRDNFKVAVSLSVRSNATPGYVAQSTSDVRVWTTESGRAGSVGDFDCGDGSFGVGNVSWPEKTYPEGYGKPWIDQFYRYYKTKYDNGAIVGGHTGGAVYGDSCLLVGAKARVNIIVDDKDSSNKTKTTYDLDANERTATWKVTPAVDRASANQGSGVPGEEAQGDATVTVTIPADLHYVEQSCSLPVKSVTVNSDGTTTLAVYYEHVVAGGLMDSFTFQTIIGAAGTDHDVDNNQQLTTQASIQSSLDSRAVNASNGNVSTASIVVVRLAAISVFKQVSPAHANPDDPHTWTLRFGNSSETDVTDVTLLDVMPYDGDDRGSKFSGTYTVRRLIVDLSSAQSLYGDVMADPGSFFWVSGDEAARDMNADELLVDPSMVACSFLHPTNVAGSVLTWDLGLDLSEIVAWGMAMDTMHGHEYMTMTLEIEPTGSKSKDVYVNSFAENATGQAAIVHSNVVRTDVEDVSFSVRKVWDGTNGFTGTPSVSVTVTGSDGSTQKLTLSEANSFSSWVKNLDRYADDGSRITYSVSEDAVPDGYELEGVEGSDTTGFVITNRALSAPSTLRKEAEHKDWL